MLKIVIIGAASQSFGRGMIVDFLHANELRGRDLTLWLVDIDPEALVDVGDVGLTAGASAPEHLVQEVIQFLRARGFESEQVVSLTEDVRFQLPAEIFEI